MREQHEQHCALSRRVLHHANKRANALTTRVARRKCLTFACECVSMHVMEHSNAAFARGEKGSPLGFGTPNRIQRKVFTGRTMQTAKIVKIAASDDAECTAGAGFASAVN
jgi:nucleoid DNA-binding protein